MASLNMSDQHQPAHESCVKKKPDHTRPHLGRTEASQTLITLSSTITVPPGICVSAQHAPRQKTRSSLRIRATGRQLPGSSTATHSTARTAPTTHETDRPLRCSDSESRPSLQAALFSAPQQSLSTTSIPGYLYRKVVPDACPLCEHKPVLSLTERADG
jgi:hypothetical protein